MQNIQRANLNSNAVLYIVYKQREDEIIVGKKNLQADGFTREVEVKIRQKFF